MTQALRQHAARCGRRRGSVYVAVLGMAALVMVLGLGGLASARAIARAQSQSRDLSGARWAALSGLELGRYEIQRNASWRTTRSNGNWFSDVPLGDATVSVNVVNPSGDLNRSPTDSVVLTATAYQASCAHTASVTLEADETPYTSLDIPIAAGGSITATSATVHASGFTIGTNGSFTALLCTINADVEASVTATGLTVNGSMTSLAPARTFPGSDAFDYYLTNGTTISGSSLPLVSGARTLRNALLSPSSNPYTGVTNAAGIYIIDAGNASIAIGPCRIVGTLVVINASGPVVLQSTVLMEPYSAAMPCLLVRGDATIGCAGSTMTESAGLTPNYNPTGTPYPWPGGLTNTTLSDSYTTAIQGLVYVSGSATVSNSPVVNQLIVGGGLTLGGTLTMGYTSDYRRDPPPGFAVVTMRQQSGSREQVVQ